jgi:hypothetical protein
LLRKLLKKPAKNKRNKQNKPNPKKLSTKERKMKNNRIAIKKKQRTTSLRTRRRTRKRRSDALF